MNIRIKFRKQDEMKFIGHLDIMRYFQKCMRRAGIAIAYSEGFSPHQIMSFAAPLGVGITSDGEYLDIQVTMTRSSTESIRALNQVMVDGMEIVEYKKLPDTAKPSMSLVTAADYTVYRKPGYQMPLGKQELEENLCRFLAQPEILITKQTKKGETVLDLKPLIYDLKVLTEDVFFLKISTGSKTNVKPELALETFYQFCGASYESLAYQVNRTELYADAAEIPVKGEQEREAYGNYLNTLKENLNAEGKSFPRFLPLGALGEEIP